MGRRLDTGPQQLRVDAEGQKARTRINTGPKRDPAHAPKVSHLIHIRQMYVVEKATPQALTISGRVKARPERTLKQLDRTCYTDGDARPTAWKEQEIHVEKARTGRL